MKQRTYTQSTPSARGINEHNVLKKHIFRAALDAAQAPNPGLLKRRVMSPAVRGQCGSSFGTECDCGLHAHGSTSWDKNRDQSY
jgi:hypothetical protein